MAVVIVNDEESVYGKVSVSRKKTYYTNDEGEVDYYLEIGGNFLTHDYVEEINTLETKRYIINGIDVVEESFGSEDHNIIYNFTAKEIIIKKESLSKSVLNYMDNQNYKNDLEHSYEVVKYMEEEDNE